MARINVDCDGVVCDFVPGLFTKLREQGFDPKPVEDPSWRTWDIFKVMTDDMREASFTMMAEHQFWRELPVIDYAQEAIAALRQAGHHIQWVTTAWDPCFGWRDARRDWLDHHFADPKQDIRKDLTVTGAKNEIWADVFIDDKPDHIIGWHTHHPAPEHRGILYRTNFNHHHHEDLENLVWSPESVDSILGWLEEKYGA